MKLIGGIEHVHQDPERTNEYQRAFHAINTKRVRAMATREG